MQTERRHRIGRDRAALGLCLVLLGCLLAAPPADSGPTATRIVRAPGKIVPIPASIPHQARAMIDRRLLPNLRYIAEHFAVYISEGYAGPLPGNPRKVVGCPRCHVSNSDHKNGMALDIGPRTWSARCDRRWKGVTRLARWAEPRQNRPRAPFRWVGYNGDSGHGCGHHLHLSWNHGEAKPFEIAAWVQVFGRGTGGDQPRGESKPGSGSGPSGGVASGSVERRPPPASGGIGPGD